VLFAPFSDHSLAFSLFPMYHWRAYRYRWDLIYMGNNEKSEEVGVKLHIRKSATPNKMPEKFVKIGVSWKSWYLGHLKELLKILLESSRGMKGLNSVLTFTQWCHDRTQTQTKKIIDQSNLFEMSLNSNWILHLKYPVLRNLSNRYLENSLFFPLDSKFS
jgi:hypothetical protein